MKFRIKEAREAAGYSQKELAQIIGVAQNTFHGYESGKHDPKSEHLSKIAGACGVSVDFLLGREEIAHLQAKNTPSPDKTELRDEQEKNVMSLVSELTADQQDFLLAWLKTTIALRQQKPPSQQK